MVYNNFPWREKPSEKKVQAVEVAAQNVLDARALFQNPPSGAGGPHLQTYTTPT